ncbi:MAG: hypothetical protein ACLFWL_13945 [Candidatus Brocadiia bacterium]
MKMYRMFHEIATSHKSSVGFKGGGDINPHITPYTTVVAMEERWDEDLSYLEDRQSMLQALRPGTRFKPHFNYHPELVPEHVRKTRECGGTPEIGVVLPENVTTDQMRAIRESLA